MDAACPNDNGSTGPIAQATSKLAQATSALATRPLNSSRSNFMYCRLYSASRCDGKLLT